MATNGRAGECSAFPRYSSSLFHQQPGCRALHKFGDSNSRGVGPMRGAEGVVHVVIREFRKLLGKLFVIGLFLGMEAQVLQQQGLALFQLAGHLLGLHPDAIGAEADVFAASQLLVQHHAQALGHRPQAELGSGLALGTAQVRRQDEPCAVAQRVLDGGQGLADARVVGDPAAIIQRDIEVHAHEDAMVAEREIADGELVHAQFPVPRDLDSKTAEFRESPPCLANPRRDKGGPHGSTTGPSCR